MTAGNKKKYKACILLGSNLGDKKLNLMRAVELLETIAGKVLKKSSVYETAAWGREDQPDFYNMAVVLQTEHEPEQLLEKILFLEKQMGRHRKEKWESRIIDMDILFFEDMVIDIPGLQIPHPRLSDRKFALIPLAEAEPGWVHPATGEGIDILLMKCNDPLEVKRVE